MSTEALTTERGKVHGDFTDVAATAQRFKSLIIQSKNGSKLTHVQREGLEMIVHKIARILEGDPNHRDHWDDIAGYAHITSVRIHPGVPAPAQEQK